MMHAGVTGPRKGATKSALIAVAQLLGAFNVTELHDGDALGVDESVYHLARAFGIHVTLHPPKNYKWRAFCGDSKDTWWSEKDYHERDRDIVDESRFLIAVPWIMDINPSGGTGYTVGYAREVGKPLVLVWPDGTATYERWDFM
jgi:hypothetical protein